METSSVSGVTPTNTEQRALQTHEREPLLDLCDICQRHEAQVVCPGCNGGRFCRECDAEQHSKHKRMKLIVAPCDFCGLRDAIIQCKECQIFMCEACDELKHRSAQRRHHLRDTVMFVEEGDQKSSMPDAPAAPLPATYQAISNSNNNSLPEQLSGTRAVYTALEYYTGELGKRSLDPPSWAHEATHYEQVHQQHTLYVTQTTL
eukprot:GGOE01057584.1.p1 GENE.GGOE01057584.1~~GGOE01057584.1.p1  ORF type:complete len:204 (-),score=14.81 GGOE01057584.1:112-723(-)